MRQAEMLTCVKRKDGDSTRYDKSWRKEHSSLIEQDLVAQRKYWFGDYDKTKVRVFYYDFDRLRGWHRGMK